MVRVLILVVALILSTLSCRQGGPEPVVNGSTTITRVIFDNSGSASINIVDFEHGGYRYTIVTRYQGGTTLLHKEKIEGDK